MTLAPHRQPRRDRVPGDPHGAAARDPHGRGLFRRRRQGAARAHGGRGGAHRAVAGARDATCVGDKIIAAAKATGAEAIHPGLRLPQRECRLRAGGDRRRADLGRAEAGQHPRHGPQGRGEEADGRGRRAGDARLSRRGPGPEAPEEGSRRDRLSGADQGGRGRRRQGHAPGRRAPRTSTTRSKAASARRRRSFGDDRVLHREIHPLAAPHRGAGVRRQPRQRRPSVRARLLAPAPPPEGDRGSARAGHGRRDPRGGVRRRGARGAGGELRRRGDDRVHRRRVRGPQAPTASGSWK